MRKSVFSKRRRGFTLIEVSLATVAGATVLMALAYTSREMSRAVEAVSNEAYLQTVVREMQLNLENDMPVAVSDFVRANPNPSRDDVSIVMPKYAGNPAGWPVAYRQMVAYSGTDSFMIAAKGGNKATPEPTPTPTSAPAEDPTPVEPPEYVPALPEDYEENAQMTFGDFSIQFWKPQSNVVDKDAILQWTDGAGMVSAVPMGNRNMLAEVKFAYGAYDPPPIGQAQDLNFTVDPTIRKHMIRLTSTFGKGEMVPFYYQGAWAPRSTTWSWDPSPTIDCSADYDGDGVTNCDDPCPWGTADCVENPSIPGGLIPALVAKAQLLAARPGDTINVFDGAKNYGGPMEEKGWTSWENDGSATYLKESIQDPSSKVYQNPLDPIDHTLNIGDHTYPNSGNSTSGTNYLTANQEVTVCVWDDFGPNGYRLSGFARVRLTSWDNKAINAVFLGFCDADGNIVDQLYEEGAGV